MKYFINRIDIKNFKFIEDGRVNFDKSNLVILDGPNGYGKTTIFDIIELAVTGKINRINLNQTDNISGCNDILYLKNQKKDAEVKVEFVSNKDSFTVLKRIDSKKKRTKKQKKSNNWDLFDTYLLEDFNEEYNESKKIKPDCIKELLGENNLDRFYNLFYYIQQEDSSSFLKNTEQNRLKVLSKLFDAEMEENELKKLEKFRDKVNGCINNLNKSKKLHDNIKLDENDINKFKYNKLIKWKDMYWDKQDIVIESQNNLNTYINELENIKLFKQNKKSFFNMQINNKIDSFSNKEEVLKSYIICSYFSDKFEEIEKKYNNMKYIQQSKKIFKSINIEKLKNFEYRKMFNIINIEDKENAISNYEELLKNIKELETNQSNLDKHIKNLNTYRLNLHPNKVNETYNIENIEENRCILCGNYYETKNELKENIDNYTNFLEEIAGESYKINENSISILINSISENVLNYINKYLTIEENIIEEDFYLQIKKYIKIYRENKEINNLTDLIDKDIKKYINKNIKRVDDLDLKYSLLNKDIINAKHIISEVYIDLNKKINFEQIYKFVFDLKKEYIDQIDVESIDNKINYIKNQYYSNQISIQKSNKLIDERITKLENTINEKIQPSIELYRSKIRSHYAKIIKEIEIPFYIYSGKIIQDYQRGLGLFIKEYDEIKNLKFVSSNDSDHDAINYLSSGQLSALVISFTLALNKVYGNKHINTILIDDPVQTMDDINIISFVELIRNEFRDKQIIISTHENEISLFMRYKFLMHNLKEKRINVKDSLR